MSESLFIRKSIRFNNNRKEVWDALVNPEKTRQYMFGSEPITDWKPGSELLWTGKIDGKDSIVVKGKIIRIAPEELLEYTVFDPNAAYSDDPANHLKVTLELKEDKDQTVLEVSQGDYTLVSEGEKRFREGQGGWDYVLEGLRRVVDGQQ